MHAGGANVLFYRPLAEHLGREQPVYALQPQGLDGERPRHTSVEEMAAHYIREMREVQARGPYYLAGSSFGGLVALEIAQQLRAEGEETALLAMFDTCGPGYPRVLPRRTKVRQKAEEVWQQTQQHAESLRLLGPEERWPYVVEKAKKAKKYAKRWYLRRRKRVLGSMHRALGRPLPKALQVTQDTISQAQESYEATSYEGVICLFRAEHQPPGIFEDETLGWKELAVGGLEIHQVPGYHGSVVSEPHVRTTAEVFRACLERAQGAVVSRDLTAQPKSTIGGTGHDAKFAARLSTGTSREVTFTEQLSHARI
jgi:thioesterase domain-containing protein